MELTKRTKGEVNAYFDGVRYGTEAWAWWKDSKKYVGDKGVLLTDALQATEDMRQLALERLDDGIDG